MERCRAVDAAASTRRGRTGGAHRAAAQAHTTPPTRAGQGCCPSLPLTVLHSRCSCGLRCSEQSLRALAHNGVASVYKQGSKVVAEGEPCEGLAVLLEGSATIRKAAPASPDRSRSPTSAEDNSGVLGAVGCHSHLSAAIHT